MLVLFHALTVFAIATMMLALWSVHRLRRVARGGHIGRVVNLLAGFIVLFLGGYAVAPFLPGLPQSAAYLLVGVVFFFGAVFVVIVLRLVDRLVRQVLEELEL